MYIYHNKKTDEYLCFGNLKALSDLTLISHNTLLYQFGKSKKGAKRYSKENFTIVKTDVIRR